MLPPFISSLIARFTPQQPTPQQPISSSPQRVAATHAALTAGLIRHGTSRIQQHISPIIDRVDNIVTRTTPAIQQITAPAQTAAQTAYHLGATTLGYGVGSAVDVATAPARATVSPDIPIAREQFARHPEQMAKGALIGAGIISGVTGGTTLLAGRGAAAASVAAPTAASTIARTGSAAGIGHATGTGIASAAVDTAIKAATIGSAAGAAAHLAARVTPPAHHGAHINIPSGNPDWVERWRDPHGGIGSRGGEIPRPDWTRGDPEVPLSPDVDWRSPDEDLSDYLDYLDKTRDGHPPGRGPMPYYQGPEIQQPGPATRHIDSPEITPAPDYHDAPEILIGRTIHAPEIEPSQAIFPAELTTPTAPALFPAELPDPRRHHHDLDTHRGLDDFARPPLHPLGDPISPTWRTPDYSERVAHALPVQADTIVDIGGPANFVVDDARDIEDATRNYGLGGYIAGSPIVTEIRPDMDISLWTRALTISETGAATATTPATAALSHSLLGIGISTLTTPDTKTSEITIPETVHPDPTSYHYPSPTPVAFPPELPPEFVFAPALIEQTRRRSRPERRKKRKTTPDPSGFGFWETLRVATPAEFLGIGSGRTTKQRKNR